MRKTFESKSAFVPYSGNRMHYRNEPAELHIR